MNNSRPLSAVLRGLGIALALFPWLFGCSSSGPQNLGPELYSGRFQPMPPFFLNGPASFLLTNATPYESRIRMQNLSANGSTELVQGELFCREGKLLFAPEPTSANEKKGRLPGVTYLWDVAQESGFVLCEALQAYAPVSTGLRFTSVVSAPEPGDPVPIDGIPCRKERATLLSSDGHESVLQVWRAPSLKNLSLKIESSATNTSWNVTLSRIRWQAPEELFAIPTGFSKYNSPEAMLAEFTARQFNYRRKHSIDYTPSISEMPQTASPGRR
jgi:hypothetical protein